MSQSNFMIGTAISDLRPTILSLIFRIEPRKRQALFGKVRENTVDLANKDSLSTKRKMESVELVDEFRNKLIEPVGLTHIEGGLPHT
jgi:hypothetical protein